MLAPDRNRRILRRAFTLVLALCSLAWTARADPPATAAPAAIAARETVGPLLRSHQPVQWWFAFKFNAATFPASAPVANCEFGGTPQAYPRSHSQSFAYASSLEPHLILGAGDIGTSDEDPLGATYGAIYRADLNYVVWNDQFYRQPDIPGCADSCSGPWGHSKGILAWDANGDGVVIQVTTPSWPAAGSAANPRTGDGNTLGCVDDNNVRASQHFFALRLTHDDVAAVLRALGNASVVTLPNNPQLVHTAPDAPFGDLVQALGQRSRSVSYTDERLSSGVRLISKPSDLHVPPWQLVSAVLGEPLRVASWWTTPAIPSAGAWITNARPVACWDRSLPRYGRVDIAQSGVWAGRAIGLRGGPGADFNHAKFAISTAGDHPYTVFGDMNQQGALTGRCGSSQNGRGGLFFVVEDQDLHDSLEALLTPTSRPASSQVRRGRSSHR